MDSALRSLPMSRLPVALALILGTHANKPCTSDSVANCGTWGYCDDSIGQCICAPGRDGPDCSELRYGACRLHKDGEMACGTFVGLPSCACRLQCEALYGGMGRRQHPICWRPNDSDTTDTKAIQQPLGYGGMAGHAIAPVSDQLSNFPEDITAVEFRTPQWPPFNTKRCEQPNPPPKCDKQTGKRSLRRVTRILGGTPMPNRFCHLSCSHRGTCLKPWGNRGAEATERYPLRGGAPSTRPKREPACICHDGYSGEGCELTDEKRCFNRCAGHGRCTGRFCLCDRGWQGYDCSLSAQALTSPAAAAASAILSTSSAAASAAASAILSTSSASLSTGAASTYSQGAQAQAAALARPGPLRATTPRLAEAAAASFASPSAAAAAALSMQFSMPRRRPKYAPTYVYPLPSALSMEYVYQRDQLRRGQYYANLRYLEQLLAKQDAVVGDPEQAALFFVPVMVMQMAGNLWHPYKYLAEIKEHLVHAYPYWNRSNGADHVFFLTTDRAGCWKPFAIQNAIVVTYLGFPAAEAYFGFEDRLKWPRQGPNRRNNAYDVRRGSPATELDCYVPGKDVVVPVDAVISPTEEAKLPKPREDFRCRNPTKAKVLLFMGGAMANMGRVEYSQGVRQAIRNHHANDTGFVLGGRFTFDDLRDSVFCLAPSGWGWGWRLTLAMITQCVPVIIQPNVTQPYEEFLPYSEFSLRLQMEDVPQLANILRRTPHSAICRMQKSLARHYRALLWQQPHGPRYPGAYELLQVALCRRAKAVARRLRDTGNFAQAWLYKHRLECPDSLQAARISF